MTPVIAKKKSSTRNLRKKTDPWILRRARGLQILEAPQLAQMSWLVHGFSTRPGGSSELEAHRDGGKITENVLNLGFTDWDTRERVLKNRQNLFAALKASDTRVIALRQINSDIVHV